MTPVNKPEFLAVLSRTFRTLRQPVPEPEILNVWWAKCEPFPLEAVAQAFSKHLDVSEFAPTPAAILKHLPKESDARPDADEAWAISCHAEDESETIVWTEECSQAFSRASSVEDETGRRMAFKSTYTRLITAARERGEPVRWVKSLGHDVQRRDVVLAQAVRDGRLALNDVRAVAPYILEDLREEHALAEVKKLTSKLTARLPS